MNVPGTLAGSTPERRFSAAERGFTRNISFTFQTIQKLCANFTVLCLGVFCKFLSDFRVYLDI